MTTPARQNWLLQFLRRQVIAHARLLTAILLGVVAWLVLPVDGVTTPILVGWNVATWVFIALVLKMMTGATHADVRRRAGIEEEGRFAMLVLVIGAAAATFVALGMELSTAKTLQGAERAFHIALALATIVGSWLFMNFAFAIHYAHEFHSIRESPRGKKARLDFPGEAEPDYWDFLYFAMVIGTTFQTSDVTIHARAMRRTVLVHGMVSFFYNTAVIALTVNIAAQLFGS